MNLRLPSAEKWRLKIELFQKFAKQLVKRFLIGDLGVDKLSVAYEVGCRKLGDIVLSYVFGVCALRIADVYPRQVLFLDDFCPKSLVEIESNRVDFEPTAVILVIEVLEDVEIEAALLRI